MTFKAFSFNTFIDSKEKKLLKGRTYSVIPLLVCVLNEGMKVCSKVWRCTRRYEGVLVFNNKRPNCFGLNCSNSCIGILTPDSPECDLIWKLSYCSCNDLRWGDTGVSRILIQYDWCPYKQKREVWTQTHTQGESLGLCRSPGVPKMASHPPELDKRQNRFFLTAHRRKQPPTTWISTLRHQDCETITVSHSVHNTLSQQS